VHATDVTHLAHGRAVDPALNADSILRIASVAINRILVHKPLPRLANPRLEAKHQLHGVNELHLDLNDFSSHLRRMRHFRALPGKSCYTERTETAG
jgi:hypothetical protein